MKIGDHLIQASKDDTKILCTPSCPVNMRLYKSSENYRDVILHIVTCMDEHLRTRYDDYGDPKSVAAINLGYPFKIIGYKKTYGINGENQFMLNPAIINASPTKIQVTTNCGSLQLPGPVALQRHQWIDVTYFDLEGNKHELLTISKEHCGFTIQNAIDQINGVTIVERAKELIH